MKIQKNKSQRFEKNLKKLIFWLILFAFLTLQGCAFTDAVKEVAEMTKKVGSASRTIRNL